jgi:CRP/FNR family transcriptional regulator
MATSSIIDFHSLKRSCADCSLHELCLPRGLDRQALEQLEKVIKRSYALHKGEYLFRTGDDFKYIYALRSGTMKLHLMDAQGNNQVLGFYFPGDILGFDAIDKKIHLCNAEALETGSYCAFPFSSLSEVCLSVPDLQRQIFRLMSRELTYENELLLTIGKKGAEERLATFLITLSSRFQQLGYSPMEIKLSMARQEIANYLNLTIETVSRLFGRFQRAGLIAVKRKHVHIKDMEALKNISSGCVGAHKQAKYSQ